VTNSSITAPVTDILAKARSGANLSAKEAIILLETTDNRLIAQIRETADFLRRQQVVPSDLVLQLGSATLNIYLPWLTPPSPHP